MTDELFSRFKIPGQIVIITGGAGLLGYQHAAAAISGGGIPILLDVNQKQVKMKADMLAAEYSAECYGCHADITNKKSVQEVCSELINQFGKIDILINNAANDPKVTTPLGEKPWSRFENFPEDIWDKDLAVGLKGSFICSQVFGKDRKSVV